MHLRLVGIARPNTRESSQDWPRGGQPHVVPFSFTGMVCVVDGLPSRRPAFDITVRCLLCALVLLLCLLAPLFPSAVALAVTLALTRAKCVTLLE